MTRPATRYPCEFREECEEVARLTRVNTLLRQKVLDFDRVVTERDVLNAEIARLNRNVARLTEMLGNTGSDA